MGSRTRNADRGGNSRRREEAEAVAENLFLPGHILSMTAGAAQRLVEAGNGDAALLYLWLLQAAGVYETARAAHALGWDGARADTAFAGLVGLGLADEGQVKSAPPVKAEPPEYAMTDITRELEIAESPFPALVQEVQRRLGKILSTSDLKALFTIYDFAGLPAEVIIMVVSWCVEEAQRKYGPGRRPRLPQIQKEALRWKERGVDTLEAAESYLQRLAALRDRTGQILALLDIRDRPAVPREREYIESWLGMGFPDEAIRMAYERTVLKKQKLNWAYMNSILRSWHQKGLHTAPEIAAGDAPARLARPRPGAGATAPQPGAPGEADRRARADMERMRRMLDAQKREGK